MRAWTAQAFGFSIEPFAFSIKNTMRPWLRSVISTLSPVSRMRFGISITDSGSVQSTSSLSPGGSVFSALRVFNAGKGHFSPARSSFVVVMFRPWRRGPHRQRTSIDEGRIGQEADHLAGRHLRDVLAEFDQSVGVRQRGQKPRAFARKLHSFEGTVRGLAQ